MRLRQALKKQKNVLFGVLILLITLLMSSITSAEEKAPDVEMINGDIVFRITSKAASNSTNIRYRTTGFTISMKPQENMVTAKGERGPDAPPTPNGYITLTGSEKKVISRTETEVITEFRIDKDRVEEAVLDAVGTDLDKLSEDTFVYLNASFETYQIINDKEVKHRLDVRTWRDIVTAHDWANPKDFVKYFNIGVPFDAGAQDNKLYYEVDGKLPVLKDNLLSLTIGESLYWDTIVTSTYIDTDNTPYSLVGTYIKSRLTEEELPGYRKMVGDIVGGKKLTATDIINGSATVLYGGLDVYMIYEPSMVEVVVKARDIDTNEDIITEIYKGFHVPGEDFSEAIDLIINANGVAYSKTKNFFYLYTHNVTGLQKVNGQNDNDDGPLSFKIPDTVRLPGRINVTVYYKKMVAGTIPVTIKAINSFNGVELQTLKTDTVAAGTDYSYAISEAAIISDGKSYDFSLH